MASLYRRLDLTGRVEPPASSLGSPIAPSDCQVTNTMTIDVTRRELILMTGATLAGSGLLAVAGTEDAMASNAVASNAAASTQSDVKAVLDKWSQAIEAKDIDRLMSLYSPDITYFDLVPPLQYVGAAALRARFLDWFGRWKGGIGQEVRDLKILASGDLATAHLFVRASGTLKDGREVGYWVRATVSCQRRHDRWWIAHEHISLPVDMKTGKGVMDLMP
jgi:ketosteroid isomerase-like protein